MNIGYYIDNIKSFLDQEKIKEVDVFGWSYGGGIAKRFTSRHSEFSYKKVVLMEPLICIISGLTAGAWIRQGYFQSLKNLCQISSWKKILITIGFNHILQMSTSILVFSPLYRGDFNPSSLDKDNTTILLSNEDPMTKDGYDYIHSKFSKAKIIVSSGTHGNCISQIKDIKKYLSG
jgi:pimeloyl-ACP methyl ester carboxylesterase